MHQLCECRTVYHSWKHCSFQFSALHLSPFLWCCKPASVRFDSASGLRLGAFACIKNDTGAFSASLRCYLLPEITCESLCSWFEPFHRYNCWAPIDFSNSYLRCGLAPKPARCLNDDTLNTSTWPSETSWCRLLSRVMAPFVFQSKQADWSVTRVGERCQTGLCWITKTHVSV